MKFGLLVDAGFKIGIAFAAGLSEAYSPSWIGIASLTCLSTPLTIFIQEVVWSSNRDRIQTSTLFPPIVLQTFTSKTKPNRSLLLIHPFAQFSYSSSRGSTYSRIKIGSSVLSVVEEHRRSVQLLPKSNLLRSTIWIVSGLLAVFQNFARDLARGFTVARHWMVLLQQEVG